jgi:guanine nucleotide-binding protein G(i) subunit alpha
MYISRYIYSFLDAWDRILKKSYRPTIMDIIKLRRETTDITKTMLKYQSLNMVLVDVGGQSHTRIEWESEYTPNVCCIIFMVSLADYDIADEAVGNYKWNRKIKKLAYSLQLYQVLLNDPKLVGVPCIVLFNKSDIFKEKIINTPLSECFPQCKEKVKENDYEAAVEYIKDQFRISTPEDRKFVSHVTCGIDTDMMKSVVQQIFIIAVGKAFETAGFSLK